MQHPKVDKHASVYFVDDDDDVRRSFTMMLNARGFMIRAFRSGQDMLAGMPPKRGDCFLIDFRMPGLNGLELLTRLRAEGFYNPAILITGDPTPELRPRALKLGFFDVIRKPIEVGALTSCLTRAIERSQKDD